jgi:DNA repair protein RadC
VILVHNHPSGNIRPSDADLTVTDRIAASGLMLDLPLMDHLIVGHGQYYSFADEGKL